MLACAGLVATAAAAQAKVYQCVGPTGRPVVQDTPCPVVNTPPPAPVPLPCVLPPEQRQRAIRLENQFLSRFVDEGPHRRAQLADLQDVAGKIRGAGARLEELQQQRKPIEIELAFYRDKPVPAWLQAKADANSAQFAALADIFRNLEQTVAGIESRYRCERETFGKLWQGAAPGSSACGRPACAQP